MPATKKVTRKPVKRVVRRPVKKARAVKRTTKTVKGRRGVPKGYEFAPEKRRRMQEGAAMTRIVNKYLRSVGDKQVGGDRATDAGLAKRKAKLAAAKNPSQQLIAVQRVMDYERRLNGQGGGGPELEAEFIGVAAKYSNAHGISYAAWRNCKVPAKVLKAAGIKVEKGWL